MDPLHYKLVYNVADSGFKGWWFLVFGLIFLLGGIFLRMPPSESLDQRRPNRARQAVLSFAILFSIIWAIAAICGTSFDYLAARWALATGTAQYVEGRVEHFAPDTGQRPHAFEEFDVKGVPFRYRDGLINAGFNNTALNGGPIQEGLPVHIWYRSVDTGFGGYEIIKLEIAEN
jgi:hypothetical protein